MIIFPSPAVTGDAITAALGPALFGAVDEYGTHLTIAGSEGWYGSPGMRRDRADRPSQHGAFSSQGYSDGRSITLSGKGIAVDAASAIKSIRALRSILSDGGSDTLTWFDPDESLPLAAIVERDSPVSVKHFGDRVFDWQMVLFAPDPRVYAEPTTQDTTLPGGGTGMSYPLPYPLPYGTPGNTGQLVLTNTGRAFSEPSFTITPPLSVGFEIARVETGQRLRYEHAVGSPLVVDCAAGTVTEAGEQRARYLTVREWFSIGPGEMATFQFSSLGPETYTDPAHLSGTLAPAYP